MKKIKKILAAVMTLAMVLGMSMTTFAADDGASITISGLVANDSTDIAAYQIIEWDAASNKWEKTDWVTELETTNNTKYFILSDNGVSDPRWQDLADAVKKANDPTVTITPDATATDVQNTSTTLNELNRGAYLVTAIGNDTEYSAMVAVTYDYVNGVFVGSNAELNAKGSNYTLTKTLSGQSVGKVAGLGDTVTFDIVTKFPSFDKDETDPEFIIYDDPEGLKITGIEVYVSDMEHALTLGTHYTLDPSLDAIKDGEQIAVNFDSEYIGDENIHAGSDVKVVVTAEVTGVEGYTNTAWSTHSSKPEEPNVDQDTGSIQITKKDQSGTNTLAGAKFKLTLNSDTVKFVKLDADGEYRLALDTDVNTVDEIEVNASGIVKVVGLQGGTYSIEETKAPDGYAINDSIPDVTINTENVSLSVTVNDDTLASLPETGGIGTTIFTVGGCIIMIAAAGLFFASRRKSSK